MASNSDDVKWNSQQKEAIERIRNWSNKTTPEMQISLSGAAGCIAADMHVPFTVIDQLSETRDSNGSSIEILYLYYQMNQVSKTNLIYTCPSMDEDGKIYHNRIDAVIDSGTKPCVHVITSSGLELICTSDHPLATKSGFHPVEKLGVGAQILTYQNDKSIAVEDTIKSISEVGERHTYDIRMSGPPHNFVTAGFVVHNTGKSTLLSAVKPFLDSKSVAWSAMTGKAALRMKEAADVEAKTLHSVLYGRPNKGRNNKLYFNKLKQPDCKFLVIDECFEYKQRVLTEHGWQQIGLIVKKKLKTKVWSRNPVTGMLELKPVIGWLEKPAPPAICHINATYAKDGILTTRNIKCTFDHKILTPTGYARAIDLAEGDEVIGCDFMNYRSKETAPVKVKWNKKIKPASKFVYDIEVADNHNYVANNVIVSNCSMIGPKMYQDLQAWAAQGVRILYVGDGYQLPPVLDYKEVKEYGNEFSVFSNVDGPRLTQVMRSGDDIIKVATQLREENQLPKHNIGSSYRIKRSATPGMNAIDEWMADNDNHMMITWRNKMRMAANRLVRKRLGFSGVIPNKTEPIMLCKNGETDSGAVLNGEIYFAEEFREAAHFGDEVKCVNFYTDNGLNIFANIQGKDEPMDGQFPNVTDWPMYMSHFKISRLPEPITLTYGYVGTAHKCVHPDTIVETPEGLRRIKDIPETGVIATDLGPMEYTNKVINPVGEMLRITTNSGYTLDVTPDHGIFITDASGYKRVEARNLQPKDVIRFSLNIQCDFNRYPESVDYLALANTDISDVSTAILMSSPMVQSGYIKELFNSSKIEDVDGVSVLTWNHYSTGITKTVQVMLLRFDVICDIQPYDGYQSAIKIYGEQLSNFKRWIGFNSSVSKNHKILNYRTNKWEEKIIGDTCYVSPVDRYFIAFSKDEASLFHAKLYAAYGYSVTKISRYMAKELRSLGLSMGANQIISDKLQYHYDEIASVNRISDAPSMCVEVPGVGRFLQNGSPQSNCQGSEYRRVTIFLSAEDLVNPHFRKDTTLPDGSKMSFASRWAYTSLTRARQQVSIILGS
jgi:hypothetical protein